MMHSVCVIDMDYMHVDSLKISMEQATDIHERMVYTNKRQFRKGSLHNKNQMKRERKRHEND